MTKTRSVVIGCAIDRAYLMPLAAMMRSILVSSPGLDHIHLYVLNSGVSEADKTRLIASWNAARVTVTWIPLDVSALAGLPVWGRMNVVTYARLLIGQLMPSSMDRLIWLDCDLVATRDIGELWALDIGANILLAARDMVVPCAGSDFGIASYKMLGVPAAAPYFNAGVMLIDLAGWREAGVGERALAYLHEHWRDVILWDQEALNVAVHGRWAPLDSRWNVIASVSGRPFFSPRHLDAAEYRRAIADPWIVHFAGTWKPWLLARSNAFRAQYFTHLDDTAWAGWRPRASAQFGMLRFYDAALRDHLYPLERWWLKGARLLTRRGRSKRRVDPARPPAYAGTSRRRSVLR